MSSLLPDNIQPIAPEQFHQMHIPQWHLVLRIVLVALALAYAYFVPARLVLVTYTVFTLGMTLYAAAQSLLLLSVILNRARPTLLHAITGIDIAGAVFVLLNDPALLPPSLFLASGLLALAVALHRQRSLHLVLGVSLLLTAGSLIARQQLLDRDFDVPYVAFMLFALVASTALLILSAHAETLRLRAARVTETDPVTGLGNRWTFYEAAKYLLPYHQRNQTPMVVMFAEIEVAPRKGKRVGKLVNQYLLKQFASIADRRLRGCDIAVHYGGNEFAFLLVDTTTKDAESIAFDMQQQFDTWAKQKDFSSYVHIGLSVIPNRPVALDQILININAALFRARQYKKGVSGAVFADPEQVR
ncbi:MAG: diguanylate cyclase [Moraxellaceae bacterium]|jgi:diguanylate cyclase (GGDEF)-like protein|nr:diguanylate cyclase [Moraxellaceae bacterium]